jgi:TPR repeat protein
MSKDKKAIQSYLMSLCAINAAVSAHRDVIEQALLKAYKAGSELSEAAGQREYDLGYTQGRVSALDHIRTQLLERAADKWKRKQDTEADQLRNLAESINLQ